MTRRERPPRPRTRGGFLRRVTMRDVLFLTVPPALLGFYFFGSAIADYHRLSQFDDWWAQTAHVHRFGWFRLRSALTLPRAMDLEARLSPEEPDAAVFRLRVDRDDFRELQRDVPANDGRWLEGFLLRGNDFHPVDLRFRGDTSAHWTSDKKSLTIKTGKRDFYKGQRRLILNMKEVLPQYLTSTLAADFGLLVPDTAVVPVYVNDRFYGIFRYIENVDESFLRRHGNMPGNIFRGDTAERGEYFKGLPRELFLNPSIWDRVAENDRPGSIGTDGLQGFVADLNGSSFEDHRRFMSWLDRDEIARYLALTLVAGDPFHMSGVHNQLWYEEPSSGTWHPIAWDVRLLDLGSPKLRMNRFLRSVLRDPRVMSDALAYIHGWLEDDRLYALAIERVESVYAKYPDEFEFDRLRSGVISDVGHPDEVLGQLRKNLDLLAEWTNDARAAVHVQPPSSPGGVHAIDVEVRGFAPLELTGLGSLAWSLRADSDLDGAPGENDVETPRTETLRLLPGADTRGLGLAPEPMHYRLFVRGGEGEPALDLRNALTGAPAEIVPWNASDAIAPSETWHPWRYTEPEPSERRLSGDVQVPATITVAEHETLVIEPGTTLHMAPGASIFSRGKVLAVGTSEAPIAVVRGDEDLPWGAVALLGQGASDSRFEFVRFLGGGGALLDRVEFKGMVDVHWAKGVFFGMCTFADNIRCDDAFNAVNADVNLVDCTFERVNADAVDFDFSSGLIMGCSFEGAGNDAIDLMSCGPIIASNSIRDADDKGISIGEESYPVLVNNLISGCATGIEVKDYSEPWIVHCVVRENEVGLNEYLKNWRYGTGGWAKLVRSRIVENGTDIQRDKNSRSTILDSRIGEDVLGAGDATGASDAIGSLQHHLGILSHGNGPGLAPDGWTLADRVSPVAAGAFSDDLASLTDGWVATGAVTRLQKRNHDLVATVQRGSGSIRLELDVEELGTEPLVALFELAGENVENVTISTADGGEAVPVIPASDPDVFVLAAVPIDAPGARLEVSFDAGRGTAEAPSRTGRVRLHRWTVLPVPKRGNE